ncbi:ferredoxin [Halalkalibacter sp. APA_J-10(15)]|uniref:(2Fe-2S) ferredoxin domain-containing protein n=1 Tax=unclassified Halalkalibacter TaxID=2893063 RepID=UPI001FF19138|nr:(2Fe-2S) ferredoxin domain-containing protein [Halalkalibacter sp. APA_J-10(15)]MCK0472894.1 (2Fe-2S) ferredoxin domain-containing protein [Halalkalibacter sp. APA_J-10(15)]
MATWNLEETTHHILICNGSSCNKAGAESLTSAIRREITNQDVNNIIHTSRTLCNGRCHDKCVVIEYPHGRWYKEMTDEDAYAFVQSVVENKPLIEKISHTYEETFVRTGGTVKGVTKTEEVVNKVSKL